MIGDKDKNISLIKKYVERSGSELIVFGELFLTGYTCNNFSELAEPINGRSVKKIVTIAKNNSCWIIFGMPELAGHNIYNTAVLAHPSGKIDSYRKLFLPNFGPFKERAYFKEGNKLEIFKTKFCKLGVMICYDIFFPELAKLYALKGAELLVCISASPKLTKAYFERVMQARAIETTTFFLYTNLVGKEKEFEFWGGSTVIGPRGDIKVRGDYFKEGIVKYNIDLAEIPAARAARPVLKDSRLELSNKLLSSVKRKKDIFRKS